MRSSTALRAEPAAPTALLRILLVEDDEFDVAVFGRAFRRGAIPCEIVRCRSGEEALEGLRDTDLELDLLVTDHQLPGLSGFDLCLQLLEQEPNFALVLLTGVGSEQMAIRALRAGIHDYIVKDSSQEYLDLLPLVLPRVARRHRQRQRRRQAPWLPSADSEISLVGLAEAVNKLGGRNWLENANGDTPTLHFQVPLNPQEAADWATSGDDKASNSPLPPPIVAEPSTRRPGPLSGRSLHVLIVHPNPIVCFVTRQAVEQAGCRAATVGTGPKALEALEREPFDLILIAAEMPDVDGLETARQIRQRESKMAKRLPILALGAAEPVARRCRQAGMDGSVPAPVSTQSIRTVLEPLAGLEPRL